MHDVTSAFLPGVPTANAQTIQADALRYVCLRSQRQEAVLFRYSDTLPLAENMFFPLYEGLLTPLLSRRGPP